MSPRGKLYLYTAFHANLMYSSIPKDDHEVVIDRCYWPLIRLADELSVPIGIEFSGYTLERIAALDPMFLETVKRLWQEGKIEVLGSGYTQAIYPLIPAQANLENLTHGNETYQRLLGKVPTVAYVNEQAYSKGLADLYVEAGYQAIMMDWNNSTKYHRYSEELQYRPQMLQGSDGKTIRILWNHSIAFQKFQRYVYGEHTLEEFLTYLREKQHPVNERAFLLYGSDLEVFDYFPGKRPPPSNPANAYPRIRELASALAKDSSFFLATPSQVLAYFPEGENVQLESPEYPVPCKKQDKYNLTRWAVTGREDTRLNTITTRLFRSIQDLQFFIERGMLKSGEERTLRELYRELAFLWASDFRTFATADKLDEFYSRAGAASARANELLVRAKRSINVRGDFTILNPSPSRWAGEPIEFAHQFAPGRFRSVPRLLLDGKEVPVQYEHVTCYPDGSIRSAVVVATPDIPTGGEVHGEFQERGNGEDARYSEKEGTTLHTPAVQIEFYSRKGGTIKSLRFPGVARESLVGHIPHGHYDDITLSPDFFTGHTILVTQEGKQLTDLSAVHVSIPDTRAFPIRVPVRFTVPIEFGELEKEYLVYQHLPRVDLRYCFVLKNLEPRSFRLGMVTFLPNAFDKLSLHYATVNGGMMYEEFSLLGHTIREEEPVSMAVSTKHCLGETEGWLNLSDNEKGLTILSWKDTLYSVPLLHYEEPSKDEYFLRVLPTISETDDVPGPTWWGPLEKRFSILAHKGRVTTELREQLQRLELGLIVISREQLPL